MEHGTCPSSQPSSQPYHDQELKKPRNQEDSEAVLTLLVVQQKTTVGMQECFRLEMSVLTEVSE
jgi:hypothetical protein